MIRGPKPHPTALRRIAGNPGKRGYNAHEPLLPDDFPTCPDHLGVVARAEWDRLAPLLFSVGVLTTADRAALAAYCQCYGRWVEAEEKLQATPLLLKTPSGYVQQSPWLSISNKQLELLGRYMAELGLTPASRSRVIAVSEQSLPDNRVTKIELVVVARDADGNWAERPVGKTAMSAYE